MNTVYSIQYSVDFPGGRHQYLHGYIGKVANVMHFYRWVRLGNAAVLTFNLPLRLRNWLLPGKLPYPWGKTRGFE